MNYDSDSGQSLAYHAIYPLSQNYGGGACRFIGMLHNRGPRGSDISQQAEQQGGKYGRLSPLYMRSVKGFFFYGKDNPTRYFRKRDDINISIEKLKSTLLVALLIEEESSAIYAMMKADNGEEAGASSKCIHLAGDGPIHDTGI